MIRYSLPNTLIDVLPVCDQFDFVSRFTSLRGKSLQGSSFSWQILFFKGPNPAIFCLFSSCYQHKYKYSTNLTIKSTDDVLGTRTQGGRMVSTDKSSELWGYPTKDRYYLNFILIKVDCLQLDDWSCLQYTCTSKFLPIQKDFLLISNWVLNHPYTIIHLVRW